MKPLFFISYWRMIVIVVFCLGWTAGAAFSQVDPWLEADVQRPSGEDVAAQRRVRQAQLRDPLRATWHFAMPEGYSWFPFDPNGAIFKDGVYHLWYIFPGEAGAHWGHLSSIDLFHWRWHAEDLRPDDQGPENNIDSGNAFLAKDGKVVISYHGGGTKGNCVTSSSDPNLDHWTKSPNNPITEPGWDPCMWLQDDTYYMISGGNPPLLFSGKDYDKELTNHGEFLAHNMPDVADFEDVSCPDFFQIGDKWVLQCISHQCGARYYIGSWNGKKFTPESHHRLNWPGGTCFAPESLVDDHNRRIAWYWIIDRKIGSTFGVMSMPRVLELAEDGRSLKITPAEEIERLKIRPKSIDAFKIAGGKEITLENIAGNSLELDLTIAPQDARRFGVKLLCSTDGREQTPVTFDLDSKTITIEFDPTSLERPDYYQYCVHSPVKPNPKVDRQEVPFVLDPDEEIRARIFIDKSVIEIFINDRLCISQIVYPTLEDSVGIRLFSDDAEIQIRQCRSWDIFPANSW